MSYEEKERELLSGLRREMNGAVAGSMAEKGLVYGLNLGVSLSDIRAVAKCFTPDHGLAMHIYGRDVRELRLAAYLIADAEQLTPGQFLFWAGGVTTTELGSNGALSLFSKSPYVEQLIFAWLEKDTPPVLMFTAVMSAAANVMHRGGDVVWDWRSLLEVVYQRVSDHNDPASDSYLNECLAALLIRLSTTCGAGNREVSEYISRIALVDKELGSYLETNVGWILV